jgi:hypothetical protein
MVVGEIAVRRFMDPDPVVVKDPPHAMPGHDCQLIGGSGEKKSQASAIQLSFETVKKRHEDSQSGGSSHI